MSACIRNARRVGLFVLILACTHPVMAGRVEIEIGTVREGGAAITATMHNIKEIDLPRDDSADLVDHAFKFELHVVEVLYGTDIKAGDVIPIAASGTGYANVWEGSVETKGYGGFGDKLVKPPEGTKVIAYLQPPKSGRRDLYFYPGSVIVLDSFDDLRVDMWRRIAKLWAMPESRDLVNSLIDGTHSTNLEFQRFCVGVLGENRNESIFSYYATNLKGVITRSEIDTVLWNVFTGNETPLEIVLKCDGLFGGSDEKTRGVWKLHPLRHEVLTKATKRYVRSPPDVNWQMVGAVMIGLVECPARAAQNREFVLELIKLPEPTRPVGDEFVPLGSPRNMLMYLARLYVPNAATDSAQELDKKIVRDLTDLSNDPKLATTAILGLCDLAKEHARIGEKEPALIALIEAAEKRAQSDQSDDAELRRWHCKNSLEQISELATRAGAAIGDTKLPARLSWPFAEQVGNQVYADTRGVGDPTGLWIDEANPRPQLTPMPEYWIAIGTLKKYEIPHFDLKPGQNLGQGLPVPLGMQPEKVAVRYVLENVSWIAVPRAPVRK